jgi:hypothetical protein
MTSCIHANLSHHLYQKLIDALHKCLVNCAQNLCPETSSSEELEKEKKENESCNVRRTLGPAHTPRLVSESHIIRSNGYPDICEQPISRRCDQDILTRGHSGEAHRHFTVANTYLRDWLANDQEIPDLYENTPHITGFEQNIDGFNDAHLKRVEEYWFYHQLCNPCQQKIATERSCCAAVGSLQRAESRQPQYQD